MEKEGDVTMLENEASISKILNWFQDADTLDERRELKANVTNIYETKTIYFEFSTLNEIFTIEVTGYKTAINTYEVTDVAITLATDKGSVHGKLDYDSGRKAIQGLKLLLLEHNFDVNARKYNMDSFYEQS